MSGQHLANRDNWQAAARVVGDGGEIDLVNKLAPHLPAHYEIQLKPPKLRVYEEGKGIILDARVRNTITGKSLYIEKKTGNNGGNAHERVYKFLSEGLKRIVRDKYNTVDEPFYLIFSGKTFQEDKYQNEFKVLLEDQQYAVLESDFKNIAQVAARIMEIV
jgi:hypothetical protein